MAIESRAELKLVLIVGTVLTMGALIFLVWMWYGVELLGLTVRVTRDGSPFKLPKRGEPTPVDPGEYEVILGAPGKQGLTLKQRIDRDATIHIPALADG